MIIDLIGSGHQYQYIYNYAPINPFKNMGHYIYNYFRKKAQKYLNVFSHLQNLSNGGTEHGPLWLSVSSLT